jgi:hypothetical protein
MATKPFDQSAFDQLNTSMGALESSLASSPTAYTNNVEPTRTDLSQEAQLKNIQNRIAQMASQKKREEWYGPDQNEESSTAGTNVGLIGRGLNALATPLYATVGGVEAILGKGTKQGFANIGANITEKGTFGDLLEKYGAPQTGLGKLLFTMPLGLALDIAGDPVSMVTMGTTSLIPRLGYGVVKGSKVGGLGAGLMAAKEGLVSKAASGASTSLGLMGGIAKAGEKLGKVAKVGDITSSKLAEMSSSLGKVAANRAELYNQLVGRNVLDLATNPNKIRVGELFEAGLEKLPYGKDLVRTLSYNPAEWFRVAKIRDKVEALVDIEKKGGNISNLSALKGIEKEDAITALFKAAESNAPKKRVVSIFKEGKEIGEDVAQKWKSLDSVENAQRLLGEAGIEAELDQIKKAYSRLGMNQTGVQWYDDAISKAKEFKIKNVPVVEKILDAYESFVSIFKTSKIGLSPVAWTNAIVGNPTMAAMGGVNITNPRYMQSVNAARKLLAGNQSPEFIMKELIENPAWKSFIGEYPGVFEKTFGFKGGLLGTKIKDISMGVAKKGETVPSSITAQLYKDVAAGKGVSPYQMATGMGANEFASSKWLNTFKEGLAEKAAKGSYSAKVLDIALNTSMSKYERIDQSFKLGTALHLSNNGVGEGELLKLARIVKMDKMDITKVGTKTGFLYKLSPERATELANEIYMNYAAMPGAVKVLRSAPLFGSPFASFLYAMVGKTAKTAAYNPAIFNKVNFLLDEVAGSKSPLEKKALQLQYYKWLNTPGMIRLPFFNKNPIYANVANMIPYYTMNMFTPSERKYKDTLPGTIIKMVDKSPLFKDPVGQVLFDYFVQPMMLAASKDPSMTIQGSFGQPLYPKGATTGTKLFYALRSLAEAPVPGVAAYGGYFQGALAPGITEYMPSYRWRQMAQATQGKNQLGITTKEAPSSRMLRSLGGSLGLPTQPVDLTFLSNQINKGK